MRNSLTGCMIFVAAFAVATGCTSKKQSEESVEVQNDIAAVSVSDTAFYGHLGEGTGMSVLQMITDSGDTLALIKTNQKTGEPGRILGEVANYTDRYAVTTCDGGNSVGVALNVSQLADRQWLADGDNPTGFVLETGGKVSAPEAAACPYSRWSLYNCQLVLGADSSETAGKGDTLDILRLTPDSLVLGHADGKDPIRFHMKGA